MRTLRRKTLQLDPQFISMITPDLSYRKTLNFDSRISKLALFIILAIIGRREYLSSMLHVSVQKCIMASLT